MREIHIIAPTRILRTHILYNGRILDKNRKEYGSLESLLEKLPSIPGFDDRKLRVYVEGYGQEESDLITRKVREYVKKPDFKYLS